MLIELNLDKPIKIDVLKYSTEIVDMLSDDTLISNFKFRLPNLKGFKETLVQLEKYIDKNISIDMLNDNYKAVTLKDITIRNISGTYCEIILNLTMEVK